MIASFDGIAGYFMPKNLKITNEVKYFASLGNAQSRVRNVSYSEINFDVYYANLTDYSNFSSITSYCNVCEEFVNNLISLVTASGNNKHSQYLHKSEGAHQKNNESVSKSEFSYCPIDTKIFESANCSGSSFSSLSYTFLQNHKNLVNA
jgi:hypothetical protein